MPPDRFSKNEIRPKVFEAQLLISSTLHRLLHIRLKLDIHPVSHLKLPFLTVLISLIFHAVLSTLQVLLDMIKHRLTLMQPIIQVMYSAHIRDTDAKMPRFVSI